MDSTAAFQVLVLAMAAAMAVEAFKSTGLLRVIFWSVFGASALVGIFTTQIASAWPAASAFIAYVGSSPVAWFFAFLAWITYLQKPWLRSEAPAVPADGESVFPTPAQRLENRSKTILACRGSVMGFREVGGYFSDYIEAGSSFMTIKRHLDPEYIKEFERFRHTPADESISGKLPLLATRFLAEVDKVAERWDIE